MEIYTPGQRVIARVTWNGATKQRNCRLVNRLLPGHWQVQVWSNWSQSYYTDLIDITEEDINPFSPFTSWGPRRHKPYVPDYPG